MKRIIIACTLLVSGGRADASQDPPQHVRTCIQYLNLPHSSLSELLSGESTNDSALHEKAFALTKDGKAKLLESSLIVCRSGQKSTVESLREEIYPTEYESPELGCGGSNPPTPFPFASNLRPFEKSPTAFETRNTGLTLEVEPTVSSSNLIDLRLVPEMVNHLRLQTWMEHSDHWGKANISFPIFETWRTNTSMVLKPGKFALVSVITPRRELPAPFTDARILLFVRADLMGKALNDLP